MRDRTLSVCKGKRVDEMFSVGEFPFSCVLSFFMGYQIFSRNGAVFSFLCLKSVVLPPLIRIFVP